MEPTKSALRKRFGAYRSSLDASKYDAAAQAIFRRATEAPEIVQASTVHIYWPQVLRGEVDTRPLIQWCRERGKRIVMPVVLAYVPWQQGLRRLDHRLLAYDTYLTENAWGLHEPPAGISVPVDEIDVVVVPALGAGRNGFRIGHGRGYYDEFLAEARAPRVALVYEKCLLEVVPYEAHDVRMDLIITETETFRPSPTVT